MSAVAEAQVILVDNRVVGRSTGVAPENVTIHPSACADARALNKESSRRVRQA